jgi:hypothetical protein
VQNLHSHETCGKEAAKLVLDIIRLRRAFGAVPVQATQRPDRNPLSKAISANGGIQIAPRIMDDHAVDRLTGMAAGLVVGMTLTCREGRSDRARSAVRNTDAQVRCVDTVHGDRTGRCCESVGLDLERETLLGVSAGNARGRLHSDETGTGSATFDAELGAFEFQSGDGRGTRGIGGAGDESLTDDSDNRYRCRSESSPNGRPRAGRHAHRVLPVKFGRRSSGAVPWLSPGIASSA